jgi:hypothetical protein
MIGWYILQHGWPVYSGCIARYIYFGIALTYFGMILILYMVVLSISLFGVALPILVFLYFSYLGVFTYLT